MKTRASEKRSAAKRPFPASMNEIKPQRWEDNYQPRATGVVATASINVRVLTSEALHEHSRIMEEPHTPAVTMASWKNDERFSTLDSVVRLSEATRDTTVVAEEPHTPAVTVASWNNDEPFRPRTQSFGSQRRRETRRSSRRSHTHRLSRWRHPCHGIMMSLLRPRTQSFGSQRRRETRRSSRRSHTHRLSRWRHPCHGIMMSLLRPRTQSFGSQRRRETRRSSRRSHTHRLSRWRHPCHGIMMSPLRPRTQSFGSQRRRETRRSSRMMGQLLRFVLCTSGRVRPRAYCCPPWIGRFRASVIERDAARQFFSWSRTGIEGRFQA